MIQMVDSVRSDYLWYK